jgi:hypothetical protein
MASENHDLKLLLSTEIITNLTESDRQNIIKCISPCNLNRVTDTLLYRALHSKLGDEGLKILEKQFKINKGKEHYNISTIVKEIYKYKPYDGISYYLDKEPSFFKGNVLSLNDPSYMFSGVNEIKEVVISQPDKNNISSYLFEFVNGDNITLKRNLSTNHVFNVTKSYKLSCDLLSFLLIAQPEQGNISITSKNPNHNLIVPGRYSLAPKAEHSRTHITYVYALVSAGNSYEIEVIYTEKLAFVKINGIFPIIGGKRQKPLQDFMASQYQVVQEKRAELEKITYKNINNCIKIKPKYIDEKREKIEKLMAIKKHHDELVDCLAEKNNHCYLDKLLEDLSQNDLKHITSDSYVNDLLVNNRDVKDKINETIRLQSELKTNISPREILKNVCLEANYARLINKIQQVPVYRTMELLKQAFTHIDEMRDKDLVLFFGNTGAGKSTSTCYYLGVDLEIKQDNWLGAIDVANTEDNQALKPGEHYPKIGQSIAASETTYVRGFNLIKRPEEISSSLMLADFPGTKDTRGKYHDLATYLSIDQTVKVAKSIKAIVLTIPYNAFLLDRGTPILEIFQTLIERIPDILDPKKSAAATQSLFLIITKHPNNSNTDTHFSNMIEEHIAEIGNAKLQAAKESNNSDVMELIERNERIWQILKEIKEQDRIDFIDIENTQSRLNMLTKFNEAPGIRKDQFAKAMDSTEVQRNFGDCIQMSMHTWQKLILERYLENLPKEIESTQCLIAQLEEDIKNLAVSNTTALEQINNLKKVIDNKRAILDKLKHGDMGAAQGEMDKLLNEIKTSKSDRIGANKRETTHVQQIVQEVGQKLKNKEQQIAKIQAEISQSQNRINALRAEIDKLSTGSRTEDLWEFRQYKHGDKIIVDFYKEGRREIAFNEVREVTANDFERTSSVIAGKYEGELVHHAYISRDYYIVPENMSDREKFLRDRFVETRSGCYRATLDGQSFLLDLGVRAAPGGRQMVYSFKTTWRIGGVIPWIKVSHSMPNITYNNALIVNHEADKNTVQKKLAELEANLRMLIKDRTEFMQELNAEHKKLEALSNELQTLEVQKIQEGIQDIISAYEKDINYNEDKIKVEQKYTENNKNKLIRRKGDLEEGKNRLKELLKEKIHFAILVRTQLGIAKLLMSFSELADDDNLGLDKKKAHSELFETCKKYKNYFKENIVRLNKACDKDLNTITARSEPRMATPPTSSPTQRPAEGLRPIRLPVHENLSQDKQQMIQGVVHDTGSQIISVLHPEIIRRQQEQSSGSSSPASVAARVGIFNLRLTSHTTVPSDAPTQKPSITKPSTFAKNK